MPAISQAPTSISQLSIGDNASFWDEETAEGITTSPKTVSHYLHLHGFNFDLHDDDTIEGIEVRITRRGIGISDKHIGLVFPEEDSLMIGKSFAKAKIWDGVERTASYGTPTLLWGEKLTAAHVNHPDFGIGISVQDPKGEGTAVITAVHMTVHSHSNIRGVHVGGVSLLSTNLETSGGCLCSGEAEYDSKLGIGGGATLSGSADIGMIITEDGLTHRVSGPHVNALLSLKDNILTWALESNDIIRTANLQVSESDVRVYIRRFGKEDIRTIKDSIELDANNVTTFHDGLMKLFVRTENPHKVLRSETYNFEKIPTLHLGGACLDSMSYTRKAGGGVYIGGSATFNAVLFAKTQPTRQIFAAQSIVSGIKTEFASGGSTISGTADMQYMASQEFVGHLVVGGTVEHNAVYNEQIGGGITLNGYSLSSIEIRVGGGARLNSSCLWSVSLSPPTSGGLCVSGSHVLQQIYEAVAPESFGLFSILTDYTDTAIGGVSLGGKGRVERLRTLTPSRLGGRINCSVSDNVFLDVIEPSNQIMDNHATETPVLEPDVVYYEQLPGWCEFGDECKTNSAVLPPIVIERQSPYLPEKVRTVTPRDRSVAQFSP